MARKWNKRDYSPVLQRIASGEYMTIIANELGIHTSTLCRNLQRFNPVEYRQAHISKLATLISSSKYKLASAQEKRELKRLTRQLKSLELAASRYAPEVFGPYVQRNKSKSLTHVGAREE